MHSITTLVSVWIKGGDVEKYKYYYVSFISITCQSVLSLFIVVLHFVNSKPNLAQLWIII